MKSAEPGPTTHRTYQSPLRAAQKEQTRQRILAALIDRMARERFDSLSMEQIAAAAEVSPATLYRYFPNREALLDGLSEQFNATVGEVSYPEAPEDIWGYVQRSFAVFDRDPDLVRAFFLSELGRHARSRGRARRIEAIKRALHEVTADLPEDQRAGAEAIIAYLASLQTWLTVTAEFGLTGAQVGKAAAWAIETLIAALRQPPPADSSPLPALKGAPDASDGS